MLQSGSLIFDAVLTKDGSKIDKFNILKNTFAKEISSDKIKFFVLKNSKRDGIVQESLFCEGIGDISITAVFKKDKEFTFVYGFIVPDGRLVSSELFEIFNDVGNVCIVLYQENGEIVFANKNFYRVLGYREKDLKGKHICEFIGKLHRDICYHHASQRLKGIKFSSVYHGVKVVSSDGTEKIFSIYGSTVVYNSKPAGILFGVDITEESNLKKLYMALKDINQAIIKVEDESDLFAEICNVLIRVGFAAAVVASVDEEKRIGINYVAGKGREFFESVFATVDGVSEYGRGTAAKAFSKGEIVINPDTESNPDMVYWRDDLLKLGFRSNCAIPIVVDGRVENILLVFSQKRNAFISEYLDLLKELKGDVEFAIKKIKSERNLKLVSKVLEEIEECVVITNEDCEIEYVNSAFVKALGYTLEDVRGRTPLFLGAEERKKECKKTEVYARLLKKSPVEFEYETITKNKEHKTFNVSVVPIYKRGKIFKFVGLMRDITIQKKQQEQLESLNRFYLTLYHLNEVFISVEDESELLKESCAILVEHLNAAASFVIVNADSKWIVSYASVRNDKMESFAKELKTGIDKLKPEDNEFPFVRAYSTNSIKLTSDISSDFRTVKFKGLVEKYGLQSCFAIPLNLSSNVFAVVIAVFDFRIEFTKKFYKLLLQVKGDIEASLQYLRNRRWNKIISIALNAGFSYVVIMDRFFRIVYMNEAALELHGYKYEEVIGKKHSIFSSNQHDREFIKRLAKSLRKGEVFSDLFVYRTKDGKLVEGYTTIIPYKEDGKIRYYIAVGKDITKEKELQKKLIFLSRHDLLTKLPNKDEFLRKVGLVLKNEKGKISAFAVIDIHNCSYINQVYGYTVGDELIKETAKRLTADIKNNDIVGRLTGDKFALFMSSVNSEEDALVKLMGILRRLNEPVKIDNNSILPSYHIGVSFYPIDGESPDDLLSKAELALVSSKSQGENEIGFFKKNTQKRVFKIIQLKDKLKKAFENNEFVLFYQPYYSIETEEIAGAEALLRWVHKGKIVPPSEFIEVLEDSNLMFDVEERIIYEAVKTVASLNKRIPISVNISPKSFRRDYIVQFIKQVLRDFGVEGNLLTVEIIERVFIDDRDYTKKVLYELKDVGVKIAVDDFGTGYSSLTYIRELPVDVVKIDMAFVRGMLTNRKDLSLVKLIISIAKEFGFKTTAEGVETKKQVEILKSMGCDYAQGYLFCKPIDKDSFAEMLK
ncbi:EAL domain-containing protein [Hippea alviniae]|uniref:EAL domain-containing protein n=1 Tax=Hippea alviniae TaxID=1279027 RepID=UPI0003B415E6|nr:EAL domain-containing protein [Hippea alviniae]